MRTFYKIHLLQGCQFHAVSFAVQFRWKAAGSERELDEASSGGDHDEDGGARQGLHEGQTKGEFPMWK